MPASQIIANRSLPFELSLSPTMIEPSALVAYAMAASRGDVAAGVTTAVVGGWDTDSAGATVGSVLGGLGAPIADSWTGPLDGRIATSMPGGSQRRIDALAAETRALALAFRAGHVGRADGAATSSGALA